MTYCTMCVPGYGSTIGLCTVQNLVLRVQGTCTMVRYINTHTNLAMSIQVHTVGLFTS